MFYSFCLDEVVPDDHLIQMLIVGYVCDPLRAAAVPRG
jgi:hypothetical protein